MIYITTEPRYTNKYVLILEGEDDDGQYQTLEQVFDAEVFEAEVIEELSSILKKGFIDLIPPHDIETNLIHVELSDLNYSTMLSGYELTYYDEEGIGYVAVVRY